MMTLVSIGLTCAYYDLRTQIKLYFNRQVMMEEEGRVKMIYFVFTVTYASRVIIDVIKGAIKFKYAGYASDIANNDLSLDIGIVYCVLYNVWDVWPLTLIMQYHCKCYAGQLRSQREYDEYQATTATATRRNDSQDIEIPLTESEVFTASLPKSNVETSNSDFYNDSILK